MMMSCGQAAVGIIANSLAAKLSMSMVWRNPNADPLQFQTTAYKNWSLAQLNEAEYAPMFAAMLLYLHSNNVECPWGATLAVTGQVVYFWGRVLTGKMMPVTPMGAFPRYIAFGLLGYAVYGTL